MENVNPKVIEALNKLTPKRFMLEVKKNALIKLYKNEEERRKAEQAHELQKIEAEIAQVDNKIWKILDRNKPSLLERGKNSFVTLVARYQFRDYDGDVKIKDTKGIMRLARKDGIVRKIAKVKLVWEVEPDKFFDYIETHPEKRERYSEFLEIVPPTTTLNIQPNGTYQVSFDKKRISPPSTKILRWPSAKKDKS